MAIVLPQGRFNNSSDKDIREYVADQCRILAVVGLHGNVFKPHTGTKTSVLLVQKWNDDPKAGPLCPRVDDYPIFFATMQEPSKDNSGDKIYLKRKDVAAIIPHPHPGPPLEGEGNNMEKAQPFHTYQDAAEAEKFLPIQGGDPEGDELDVSAEVIDHYETTPKDLNEFVLDAHEHLIVKHDLFNHDGLTKDGIAEAFIEFAKKENLSFFR